MGLTAGLGFLENINPLNAELIPICQLLALLGAHPILHVSRIRVKPTSPCRKSNPKLSSP